MCSALACIQTSCPHVLRVELTAPLCTFDRWRVVACAGCHNAALCRYWLRIHTCGVKPHCEATFTTRTTLPAYFDSLRSFPLISCIPLARCAQFVWSSQSDTCLKTRAPPAQFCVIAQRNYEHMHSYKIYMTIYTTASVKILTLIYRASRHCALT